LKSSLPPQDQEGVQGESFARLQLGHDSCDLWRLSWGTIEIACRPFLAYVVVQLVKPHTTLRIKCAGADIFGDPSIPDILHVAQ
jgi:hypothetical protein